MGNVHDTQYRCHERTRRDLGPYSGGTTLAWLRLMGAATPEQEDLSAPDDYRPEQRVFDRRRREPARPTGRPAASPSSLPAWAVTLLGSVSACLVGCSPEPPPEPATAATSTHSATTTPRVSTSSHRAPEPTRATLQGEVIERIEGSTELYLQVETSNGTFWVGVPRCGVSVGDEVTVDRAMPIAHYDVPMLDRSFETIYFGLLSSNACARVPQQPLTPKPVPTTIPVIQTRHPAARRIVEIVERAEQLAGQTVRVQGMVVKASPDILARHWLHLKDGSGSAEQGTDDLLVTSTQLVAVGSVVEVTGTVAVNERVGATAPFPLLVEASAVRVRPDS